MTKFDELLGEVYGAFELSVNSLRTMHNFISWKTTGCKGYNVLW